ncbi:segregation/condensation protein A [Candidatus Woesearchaeota archaeon]|nr:segregation/condensation protein A [Candidatus Woesearchaeota archaeon]
MVQVLKNPEQVNNDKIFSIIFQEDELTWQNIIYDLVQTEQMDPWDVNVSLLSAKFIEKLRELKELDFRISGKVVLAAAILLKIKSTRLVNEDMLALDNIINSVEDPVDLIEELGEHLQLPDDERKQRLVPRTPQPRKRKISVFDLVTALEKALDLEAKRPPKVTDKATLKRPEKKFELGEMIASVYTQVKSHFDNKTERLKFHELIPSDSKEDKIYTFIPLLHLENQRKVDMSQKVHWGEIDIALAKKGNLS